MIRVVFTHLLLLFLPFLAYGLWLWLNKKAQTKENWQEGPIGWLAVAGIAIVIVSLVLFANFKQAPEGLEYRPSQMQDGVFVPGGYE